MTRFGRTAQLVQNDAVLQVAQTESQVTGGGVLEQAPLTGVPEEHVRQSDAVAPLQVRQLEWHLLKFHITFTYPI